VSTIRPSTTAPIANSKVQPTSAERPEIYFSRSDVILLVMVLLFYITTRLVAIEDFPIFFFCDEAIHANLARELVDNGFRDDEGHFLPAYFRNVATFNLSLSVWLHVPGVVLFGKSITVVRATSVVVGLVGVAALMLSLKWFYQLRLWWAGGLVMAALPAWFLHSRTAFETAMMVGFYSTFVLAYLLYREVSPRWLPAAVVCGAATFYSYSNGQGVMFVSTFLLLVTDWRYHLQVVRRRPWVAAAALVTGMLLAGPYLHFRFVRHPEMLSEHLGTLGSPWVTENPLHQKLAASARTYGRGLSPRYWFTDDTLEIVRHRMRGYGYLPIWLAPAVFLGIGIALWRCRGSPAYRLALIAVLAAPFSASLVGLRITRVLAMMVPASILATAGLDVIGSWLRRVVPGFAVSVSVGLGLVAATTLMTVDALANGPTWFSDYELYGQQYGAKQVFGAIRETLAEDVKNEIWVTPGWANNTNAFLGFFLSEEEMTRTHMGALDHFVRSYTEIEDGLVFVFTGREYDAVRNDPRLVVDQPTRVIPYPDGRPGFVFFRAAFSAEAPAIRAAEQAERRMPVNSTVTINGKDVELRHPKIDIGHISDAFDGDPATLARTLDADPATVSMRFPAPRPVSGVRLQLWTERYDVALVVTGVDGSVTETAVEVSNDRSHEVTEISLSNPIPAAREVLITIQKYGDVHIHMQEIEILP
jgi:hypothetical protein